VYAVMTDHDRVCPRASSGKARCLCSYLMAARLDEHERPYFAAIPRVENTGTAHHPAYRQAGWVWQRMGTDTQRASDEMRGYVLRGDSA
jgi:hypothetical protein